MAAMQSKDDEEDTQRRYKAPYTSHRPIPTIQKYEKEKEQRQTHSNQYASPKERTPRHEDDDAANRYLWSTEHSTHGSEEDDGPDEDDGSSLSPENSGSSSTRPNSKSAHRRPDSKGTQDGRETTEDTSETLADSLDPKQRRKQIGKRGNKRAEREVTDPVTHLPIRIHDLQSGDLKKVPENLAPPGSDPRTATGLAGKSKSDEDLHNDTDESQQYHNELENLFPPPEYEAVKQQLTGVYSRGIITGLTAMALVGYLVFVLNRVLGGSGNGLRMYISGTGMTTLGIAAVTVIILGIRKWMDNRISTIWDEELWHAQRHDKRGRSQDQENADTKESTHWLNNVLSSVWPLVNPDLFISLADTLEDVMQASLPSIVRMVSIDDIGQGSESIRILGVRWLPTGAASRSVGQDGKLGSRENSCHPNDRSVPGEGDVDTSTEKDKGQAGGEKDQNGNQNEASGQEQTQIAEGMEAEEGDFINLEVAFSYRTRSSSQKFQDRAKHAHLYVAFYLPGHIKLPVYVDLRGVVGIARVRLQLCPDPPFFSLMTFTFLGQPKVDLACIPLTKRGLNLMDLPLISNFVQSAVDAAMAEYVAPKSMTLDLKDMLAGDDFKKDTRARGVIVCKIKRAFDFKQGDAAIPLIRDGSADPYVTIGWAKFVKPLWSSRVILSEMEPHWEETAFILVTPDELNVDERLRIQLWDSDRLTADDDLGRIEMDLKEVMRSSETRGKMSDRIDGFKALKAGEGMPGKLEWSVGYFPKTRIREAQLKTQTAEPEIRTKEQLERRVDDQSQRKLREAKRDESSELEQLRMQEYKEIEDRMIISSPPLQDFPSGILAIQIHEATGLEVRALHNADRHNNEKETSDEEETSEELPSCYCNIIVNHQKVYRTRVKPKNQKPFFNAGTERFIRDWRNTSIHISVRDSRVHEDDPLMGLVRLNLVDVLKDHAQVNNTYPLYGGVGYGRVRVSLVFRSINLQVPRNLIGWDYGTLVISPTVTGTGIAKDLHGLRLKLQTSLSTGHMYGDKHVDADHQWSTSHNKKLHLAVKKRYSSPLIIQFRKDRHFLDKTAAFAVLWLIDLEDDKETTLTLPVWKGDLKRATTCYLKECGEKVGELQLKLTYCKGLDKAHKKLAAKDENLRDVMEVIDTSRYASRQNDEETTGAVTKPSDRNFHTNEDGAVIPDEPSSSDSSSDEDDDDDHHHTHDKEEGDCEDGDEDLSKKDKLVHFIKRASGGGAKHDEKEHDEDQELQKSGERGLRSSIRDYREHANQMHRRHRGIMQHKSARTLWWMKHKVEDGRDKVGGLLGHHERVGGVETEV